MIVEIMVIAGLFGLAALVSCGMTASKFREYRAERPFPPCGDTKEHYYWADDGWPCPICTASEERT